MRLNEEALRRYVRRVLRENATVVKALASADDAEELDVVGDAAAYEIVDRAAGPGVTGEKAMGPLGESIVSRYVFGYNLNTPETPAFYFADVYSPENKTLYSVKSAKLKNVLHETKGVMVGRQKDIKFIEKHLREAQTPEGQAELNFGLATFSAVRQRDESYALELLIYPNTLSYDAFVKEGGPKGHHIRTRAAAEKLFGDPSQSAIRRTLKKPDEYSEPSRDVIAVARTRQQFEDLYSYLMAGTAGEDKLADELYGKLKDELPP